MFVDDNPAERALVADQLPEVAVPECRLLRVTRLPKSWSTNDTSNLTKWFKTISAARRFIVRTPSEAPANRGSQTYGDFLTSLQMSPPGRSIFRPVYLERITQLINKTNQFNLTTRRYTSGEVEAIAQNPAFLTLYGRLTDKFGDNGLVSVLMGEIAESVLRVDLWLMSCRVLKREMEFAMFDALVEHCQTRGVRRIVGVYIPSKKNGMVAGHYASLGFSAMTETSEGGGEWWSYDVPLIYSPRRCYIRRAQRV